MDEGGCVLCCLNEVWLDGVDKKSEDRTGDSEFLDLERCAVHLVSEKDVVDASSHVIEVFRETEDRHDL